MIPLYIIGKNEVFGIEEIVDNLEVRSKTVICESRSATCLFMKIDDFCDFVNQNKFGHLILQEQFQKLIHYKERISQTVEFKQNNE